MFLEVTRYLEVVLALVSIEVDEDHSRAVIATLWVLHHWDRLDLYLLPVVILRLLVVLFLEIRHDSSEQGVEEEGELIYLRLDSDQSRPMLRLLDPLHDFHNIVRKGNQILGTDTLGFDIVLNIHPLR